MIGAGHWGPHLIRNFHRELDSQVRWIVDTDQTRLDALARRFPDVPMSQEVSEALNDDRVDAVVVATPSSTHFEIGIAALRSGKHVLIEKPITDSSETAQELCTMAQDTGLILMVGHVFLFNPAVRAAKEYIESGELGAIHYVSMVRTSLGPVRRDVNAAWDLASHDLAIADYWLGDEATAVNAVGGTWINTGIEDAVFITVRYPANRIAHVEASWLNPRKMRSITVVGERRMLTLDDMDLNEPLRVYDKRIGRERGSDITDTFAGFRDQIREGIITIPKVTLGEPLRAECVSFLDRIHGSGDTVSDGWAGLNVVRVLEAVELSISSGGAEIAI